MKRTLFLISMLFGLLTTVQAQTGLALTMDKFEAKPGETKTLNVSLSNPGTKIIAVQFTMTLPNGVTLIKTGSKKPVLIQDRIGSEYDPDAEEDIESEKSINVGTSNPYTFSIFATADQIPFAGEEGPIMTFNLKAATDAAISVGEIKISDIELTEKGAANPTNLSDFTVSCNIYESYQVTVSANEAEMGTVTGGTDAAMSGTPITVTATPATGYDFVNWTEGETVVSSVAEYIFTPTKDVALTANFTPHIYKATFNSEGKSEEKQIAFGATIEAPEPAAKTGYTFSAWENLPETMPAQDITVTALYSVDQYAISYDLAGGALAEGVTNAATYTIESEAITLGNPTRTGYTFAGWTGTDLDAATVSVTIAKGSTGARSYVATWTVNQYKVTFLADGQTVQETTLDYGATITAPSAPEKSGYTFKEWTPAVASTVPAEDVTYTAVWEVETYAISYDLAGGALAEGVTNAATYTIESEAITLGNPTRTGYTFAGWTGTDLDAATVSVTIAKGSTGARSYVATWTVNQYKVTFLADGQTVQETTLDYGATITAPSAPEKSGYTFKEWTPAVASTVPAEDVTYTAVWEVETYAISYDLAGGALAEGVTNAATYTIESEAITLGNPTRTGYTFAGWTGTDLDAATVSVTIAKGSTGARNYVATWTVNQYKVTFLADGQTVQETTLDYGATITAPSAPEKTGYTFKEWTPAVSSTVPAEDVTYTAVYDINTYTLTYIVDGEIYKTYPVEYGATITPEAEPTKDSHSFSGWSEIPATMPANDVTVTGTFTFVDRIFGIVADGRSYQIYTANGIQVKTLQKGVNYIRFSNGQVKKIMVK